MEHDGVRPERLSLAASPLRKSMIRKTLRIFLAALLALTAINASAQFVQGQVLTAAQLNSALSGKVNVTGGTSQLQYLQGATGSAARSVASKLQDVVNVRDFGATCNGTGTGDTAGITAAINAVASSGGEVDFPAGSCLITPVAISNAQFVRLKGAGRYATSVVLTSTGTAITWSNSQWITVTQMTFAPSGAAQSIANANGMQFDTQSDNAHVDEVNFIGFSKDGLRFVGTSDQGLSGNKVSNSYFLGNGGNQLYMYYNNDFHVRGNQFGMLQGIAHAAHGAYLVNSSAGSYTENYHWSNTVGFQADNSNYNTYSINRFEQSDKQNVYLNGGTDIVFTSNKAHTGSQASSGTYDNVYVTGITSATFASNVLFSWDASYMQYGFNFDTGCSDVSVGKNKIGGFSPSFGPMRNSGSNGSNVSFDFHAEGVTPTTVAAGSTVYLGTNGAQSVEAGAQYVVPRKSLVARVLVQSDAAPGASQTYTVTLRKNGVNTPMVATISGASSFAAAADTTSPVVLVAPDDSISLQAVTTVGAAPAHLRYYIEFAEY